MRDRSSRETDRRRLKDRERDAPEEDRDYSILEIAFFSRAPSHLRFFRVLSTKHATLSLV